jgi:hypothetical protein
MLAKHLLALTVLTAASIVTLPGAASAFQEGVGMKLARPASGVGQGYRPPPTSRCVRHRAMVCDDLGFGRRRCHYEMICA